MVWTDRYPWIVESALKNRHRQFVIDGEAVVPGVDGIADFNAPRVELMVPVGPRARRSLLLRLSRLPLALFFLARLALLALPSVEPVFAPALAVVLEQNAAQRRCSR